VLVIARGFDRFAAIVYQGAAAKGAIKERLEAVSRASGLDELLGRVVEGATPASF